MSAPILPPEALAQHIAVLGKTGSGKSYAAKHFVEGILAHKGHVCIVDPTSAWWGLRSSADGTRPGFGVLVLGGDHGDMPLPALGGAAVARLVTEQRVSCVLDTSQLTIGERTRWFTDFAGTLYRTIKAPLHLVIDEAHNFMPQGRVPDPEAGKMLHAGNQLMSGGRSRGIRGMLITQRPAKLHKDSLTCADTLIAMRVIAPQDREAIEDWILGCGDKVQGKQVLESLASLERGEGWVWYPEGKVLKRTKFPRITTFDSSATPTDGHEIKAPKHVAEIDLTEIRSSLAEAAAEADANDPKKLRARIAELEAESRRRPAVKVDEEAVQRAVARAEKDLNEFWQREIANVRTRQASLANLPGLLRDAAVTIENVATATVETSIVASKAVIAHRYVDRSVLAENRNFKLVESKPARKGDCPAPHQRILDALAWWESLGTTECTREQLAARARYTVGGRFNRLVGELMNGGKVYYPIDGHVALTDAGRKEANHKAKPQSLKSLHDDVLSVLDPSQGKIMGVLLRDYPSVISRAQLAHATDYEVGGRFNRLVGELKTRGLITYPSDGAVKAADFLFPQGVPE